MGFICIYRNMGFICIYRNLPMFDAFLGLDNPNLLALDMLSWWAAMDLDAARGGGTLPPSMVRPAMCRPAAAAT
jgi:hypothetical protein